MYYIIIECSNVVEKPLICTVENLKEYGFGEDDFMRGRRIEKWTEDIFFKTDEICCHGNPDINILSIVFSRKIFPMSEFVEK